MELTRTPVEIEGRPGWFEQYLPAPEACKRIQALARNRQTKKARTICITAEQRGKTSDDRYFPILGSIRTTRSEAVRFVTDAYKNFTERGALVHLVWTDNILFIG